MELANVEKGGFGDDAIMHELLGVSLLWTRRLRSGLTLHVTY